jgi:hypothetical protein
MYHLLKGLREYLTRKEQFSVIIIGLDGAGKTVRLVCCTVLCLQPCTDFVGEDKDAV